MVWDLLRRIKDKYGPPPDPNPRELEAAGQRSHDIHRLCEFVKPFEGLRLSVYRCPAGVETAGWGSTRTLGKRPFKMGQRISVDMAEKLLWRDCSRAYDQAVKLLPPSATSGAKIGVGSFVHNLGASRWRKSNARRAFVAGHIETFKKEYLEWSLSRGERLPGLVKRRRKELTLILGED